MDIVFLIVNKKGENEVKQRELSQNFFVKNSYW